METYPKIQPRLYPRAKQQEEQLQYSLISILYFNVSMNNQITYPPPPLVLSPPMTVPPLGEGGLHHKTVP